ncbi:MAG TPA: hypothetical protein VGL38_15365 [bacterium]
MNLSRRLAILWALALVATALLLPGNGAWTIDDSIKHIAARSATGPWADVLPDGSVRSELSDPAAFPPLHAPFATRVEGGFAFGFSPWTRALFKLIALGGNTLSRLAPALFAIALWLVLARRGFAWAFLLLPLTFYGLVPWEHVASWLLLWPAVWLTARPKSGAGGLPPAAAGFLFALSVLLRPETALLGAVLGAWLLITRSYAKSLMLAAGAAAGIAVMMVWHALTSTQPALTQIGLNLIGPGQKGLAGWLTARPEAFYGLLVRMDLAGWLSALLLAGFACGVGLLLYAEKKKSKTMLGLALGLLLLWVGLYQYRLWSATLPPLVLMYANSLLACLPWVALLAVPPYRNRPALYLALATILLTVLSAPVWEGVHWGPRILLAAVPLLLIDLYQSGRARGWAFGVLLALTAVQTLSSAALVQARYAEISDRIRFGGPKLGTPIICPTMSQCADLAPLWPEHEFFTAANPTELRQLLIELRGAHVDTVWLHLGATDPLYVQTFPDAKPVWPYRMTLLRPGTLYKTTWRIYELVMNRGDSLWAGLYEAEAGRFTQERQLDAALKMEREAVAIAPGSAQCHNNLALILAARGDISAARDEATIALQLAPDLKESRRLLDMLQSPSQSSP